MTDAAAPSNRVPSGTYQRMYPRCPKGVALLPESFRPKTSVFSLLPALVTACFFAATSAHAQKFVPTNQFARGKIQDFEVMIHTKIVEDKKLLHDVQMEAARQLHHIEQSVPKEALKVLRQVRVWIVRHGQPNESSAVYHPDPRWLRDNGYNPDMGGGIAVPDADRFLEFSKTKHFNILLHEMAHAYEYKVLGHENPELKATYRRALDAGLYRDTYHRHSHHEYFAELTEAYFGKNDYFPRTKEEAKQYDPLGVRFLEKAWGVR
jgi:hypothetical protein